MTPEELKQLQAEHDKAMEAINAFNAQAHELNNVINDITGK